VVVSFSRYSLSACGRPFANVPRFRALSEHAKPRLSHCSNLIHTQIPARSRDPCAPGPAPVFFLYVSLEVGGRPPDSRAEKPKFWLFTKSYTQALVEVPPLFSVGLRGTLAVTTF